MSIRSFSRNCLFAVPLAFLLGAFALRPLAVAGSLETVIEDFSPVSGYVVMARGGDYIVDVDASQGVVQGDLFGVVSPGDKIVHPVTGKVIGNLEKTKAVLKIVRIKSGFSHARLLGEGGMIEVGDAVRRCEGVKAVFWDYTGKGKPLFLVLRDELGHMDWTTWEAAERMKPSAPSSVPEAAGAVAFVFKDGRLTVRDPEFLVLREYAFAGPVTESDILSFRKRRPVELTPRPAPAVEAPPAKPPSPPSPVPAETAPPAAKPAEDQARYAPVMDEKSEGVQPVYQRSNLMEKLPGGPVVMSDFMPFEDGLLLAATDGSNIAVYKVSNDIVSVAKMETPLNDPVVFLSWWAPRKNESPMLAVVHYSDHAPLGSIWRLENGRLVLRIDNIGRFIGAFDADGDDVPETLLGQRYDPEEFFDYKIHEAVLSGDDIDYRIPSVKLPRRFTVSGGLLADVRADGTPESVFVRDEILYVYGGGEPLYKSSKQMGGSLSKLVYEVDPTAKNVMTNSVSFEIPPVAADLDGDGTREILAVASERTLLAHSGISPGIKRTWLAVFKYENGVFSEGTLGEKMNTPIQGMAVFGGKVLLVVSETGSLFSEGGKSRLLELPLADN